MRIRDFLDASLVIDGFASPNKEAVVTALGNHIGKNLSHLLGSQDAAATYDSAGIVRALLDREELGSTGIGDGVAIPHAKIPGLPGLVAGFGRAQDGVAFDAMDNGPVHLFFVLLVPENSAGMHLKALARISRLLKSAELRQSLLDAADPQELYAVLMTADDRF